MMSSVDFMKEFSRCKMGGCEVCGSIIPLSDFKKWGQGHEDIMICPVCDSQVIPMEVE